MGGRNSTDAPSQDNIRNQGGIPFASQIPNDAAASGEYLDDAVDAIDTRVVATEAHSTSAGLSHSYLADNLVDVVVAVADASGGATDALMTVQVNDLAGTAIGKVCEVMFYASDTQYAGLLDPNANITIGTVTAGSVLASAAASGWWLLKTDATGLFAATATNASDETVYFNAATCEGGVDGLTAGVVVRGCVPDDATWSA